MPVLREKHIRRMQRENFRFGMPESVAFVKQVSGGKGKSSEKILFTKAQDDADRNNKLRTEVEQYRALSREVVRQETDAGVISFADGEIAVTGKPDEVYMGRIATKPDDALSERLNTVSSVQRLAGSKTPVNGNLAPTKR